MFTKNPCYNNFSAEYKYILKTYALVVLNHILWVKETAPVEVSINEPE